MVVVKCRECGREYALSEDEKPSNFSCECGGSLTPTIKRTSEVKKKEEAETCKNCGNKLPENAKICPECGFGDTEIRETKYCTNCALKLMLKLKYVQVVVSDSKFLQDINRKKKVLYYHSFYLSLLLEQGKYTTD